MSQNTGEYLATVSRLITTYFDLEEVKTLCLELGVDFDNLRGETKSSKVRELVLFFARKNQFDVLLSHIEQIRPLVDWPSSPKALHLSMELTNVNKPDSFENTLTDGSSIRNTIHNLHERSMIPTFVGRDKEAKTCISDLLEGKFRIISITGMAGIGKTTFATQIAWRLISRNKFNTIYFLDLTTARNIDDIFREFASILNIEYRLNFSSVGNQDLDEAEFIQKKDQLVKKLHQGTTLIVLDNFERLIKEEACIRLVRTLANIPTMYLLITSRPALNLIPWEKEYELPPLTPADSKELLIMLSKKQVSTLEDEHYSEKLCALVHHVPLAIELISQHTQMGFSELWHKLEENRLFMLRAERTGVERKLTDMSISLSLSYDLLSKPEKELFLTLSLFRARFSQEAVENITFNSGCLTLLMNLCNWKLIKLQANRFFLLETMREFAEHRLHQEGKTMGISKLKLNKRLANYYLQFVEGSREDYSAIEAEHENIIGSLDYLSTQITKRAWARKILVDLCYYLGDFWRVRGQWKIAQKYTRNAIRAAEVEKNPLAILRMSLVLCQARVDLGLVDETGLLFQQAIELADQNLTDNPHNSDIQRAKALLLHQYGRYVDNCIYKLQRAPVLEGYSETPTPEHYFQRSLKIWNELADERQIIRLNQALGFRAMVNDDLDKAVQLQLKSLESSRKTQFRELEGRCLHQLGRIAKKLNDLSQNRNDNKGLSIIRQQLDVVIQDGQVQATSDIERADVLLNKALSVALEIGDQRGESRTRREIGSLKMHMAHQSQTPEMKKRFLSEAREQFQSALEISRSLGERQGEEKIMRLISDLLK